MGICRLWQCWQGLADQGKVRASTAIGAGRSLGEQSLGVLIDGAGALGSMNTVKVSGKDRDMLGL